MIIDPHLQRIVAAQPYPRLFATISGVHSLPLKKVIGLGSAMKRSGDKGVIGFALWFN